MIWSVEGNTGIGLMNYVFLNWRISRKTWQKFTQNEEESEEFYPEGAVEAENEVFTDESQFSFLLTQTDDKLSDLIGIDEVKEEINEVIEMLKDPVSYEEAGAKLIRGILLVGKPGTGKTKLARALANESNVNFIQCNSADFEKAFVGEGSRKIRELFDFARENQPCIIFIDEIDSLISKSRRSGYFLYF